MRGRTAHLDDDDVQRKGRERGFVAGPSFVFDDVDVAARDFFADAACLDGIP